MKAKPQTLSEKKSILLLNLSADKDPVLKHALIDFDFDVVAVVNSTAHFLKSQAIIDPDILVLQVEQPDEELLESLVMITQTNPKPIIMFAERSNTQLVENVVKSGVSAYIVDEIQPTRIKNIIDIALARHQSYNSLLEELNDTKSKLAERKLLDKAKGLLMKHKNISEDEAFGILRKMAMDKGIKIAQVAEQMIDTISILEG